MTLKDFLGTVIFTEEGNVEIIYYSGPEHTKVEINHETFTLFELCTHNFHRWRNAKVLSFSAEKGNWIIRLYRNYKEL